MGFHIPPFTSVPHLHLHVLSPASKMGMRSQLRYGPQSHWFITVSGGALAPSSVHKDGVLAVFTTTLVFCPAAGQQSALSAEDKWESEMNPGRATHECWQHPLFIEMDSEFCPMYSGNKARLSFGLKLLHARDDLYALSKDSDASACWYLVCPIMSCPSHARASYIDSRDIAFPKTMTPRCRTCRTAFTHNLFIQ